MIDKENIKNILPLTPMQEGMLFHYLIDPRGIQYFEHLILHMKRRTDVELFKSAWERVFEENEMLNVVFRWDKIKKPVQIVLKKPASNIIIYDFSGFINNGGAMDDTFKHIEEYLDAEDVGRMVALGETARAVDIIDRTISKHIEEERINLESCNIRIILCKYGARESLHIVYHHILLDGWSLGIMLNEFVAFYTSAEHNGPVHAVKKAKFKDYYERVYLSLNKEKEQNYWREYLHGYERKEYLQMVHKHQGRNTYDRKKGAAASDLVERIRFYSKNNNVSIASILYSAWGLLLCRFYDTDDIVFGTTVSGRDVEVEYIENTVGLFVNTVPLRAELKSADSVDSFIQNMHLSLVERRKYEKTSLIDISNATEIQGAKSLFDSIVVIENYPIDKERLKQMNITSMDIQEYTTYPITLVVDLSHGIDIELVYDTDLFEGFVIDEMMSGLKSALNNMIERSGDHITDIPLINKASFDNIVIEFNNTERDYPCHKTVVELFRDEVKKYPDKIAVVYGSENITYHELNRKSDCLAALLLERDIQLNDTIGLLGNKSINMITGMMGILKAGASYITINPELPVERKQIMLKQVSSNLLIADSDVGFDIAPDVDLVDIRCDELFSSDVCILSRDSAESIICVIYTSGSTGMPKGIMIKNRGIIRLVKNTNYIDFTSSDKILSTAPFEFDASLWEIWGSLLNGATLFLLDKYKMLMPTSLKQSIQDNLITKMWMSAPLFNQMVQVDIEIFDKLKYLIIGGAVLSPEYVNRILDKYHDLVLVNGYGPTENTVFSTYYEIKEKYHTRIPIGRPIQNTAIYILDKDRNLLPVGAIGEIYAGKDGVAQGYYNNPELTGQCFLEDPFCKQGKMYKTGDKARWLPDGVIDFLGRSDFQVKIRGVRIEIDEIEHYLSQYEKVHDCAVVVREGKKQDKELVAYIAGADDLTKKEIKQYLQTQLPEQYIPSCFILIKKMPINANGKIDRTALPDLALSMDRDREIKISSLSETESKIMDIWKKVLNISNVGINDNYFDIGGNSINTIQIVSEIKQKFDKEIQIVDLFKYTTIKSLSKFIIGENGPGSMNLVDDTLIGEETESRMTSDSNDIAIVGMACKFPKADNKEQYWNNLINGRESISFFSDEELRGCGVEYSTLRNPKYVKAKGVVNDIEYFDADFFAYSPREAEEMDPQLRLLHEYTWLALENAGYDIDTCKEPVGLYVGGNLNNHWLNKLSQELTDQTDKWKAGNFNFHSLSMPISYKLNLTGPSITVKTACSSSLTAVHLACNAILQGECSMAIAGGCSISLPQKSGYLYQEGMIKSPDGHCRAFDRNAQGTVGGDGVGLVLLKKLEDAVRDGDHVYAVIKGTAVNNDGSEKVGFTAPSVEGQAQVIRKAQQNGHVEPDSISYIEAHGTGTPLGDPIELRALNEAFNTDKRQYCAIGSVKTNIGHLDAAAGIAGLIKTVLALQYKMIPPSLNYKEPNAQINFSESPFYVNTEARKWEFDGNPLRAGVSSFGIGGTNVHVVLEEYKDTPQEKVKKTSEEYELILLSAKTEGALKRRISDLLSYLYTGSDSIEDIAYTLQVGRKDFKHKAAYIIKDGKQLIDKLESTLNNESIELYGGNSENDSRIVFMFPGQGSQYRKMGKQLYDRISYFRNKVDELLDVVKDYSQVDIKGVWLAQNDKYDINQTEVAQIIIFIVEYALAKLMISWGIEPDVMIGHSLGEYTAACLSGVFSEEDAVKLVCCRSGLMQQMEKGGMLAVHLGHKEVEELLSEYNGLSIAAINSSQLTVVSGAYKDIESFQSNLSEKEIPCAGLHVSHAFHSEMMTPMLLQYEEMLKTITLNKPKIPYISNLTGSYVIEEQAVNLNYYLEHIRETVQFSKGIEMLAGRKETIYLEIGPGAVLSNLVKKNGFTDNDSQIISTMGTEKNELDDVHVLYQAIAQIWACGGRVNWKLFQGKEERRRIELPGYSFEKEYYWRYGDTGLDPAEDERVNDIENWFYLPGWKRKDILEQSETRHVYVVFNNQISGISDVVSDLRKEGNVCINVMQGKEFAEVFEDSYTISGDRLEDYIRLFNEIIAKHGLFERILYLWSYSYPDMRFEDYSSEYQEEEKHLSFLNLVLIAKAIAKCQITSDISLMAVTKNMASVTPEDRVNPFKALIQGAVQVIPLEYKNINTVVIDVDAGRAFYKEVMASQSKELLSSSRNVAFRNERRYELIFRRSRIPKTGTNLPLCEMNGVYIITGGLGGIGLVIAENLVDKYKAEVALVSRQGLPERADWDRLIENRVLDAETENKMNKIIKLETYGKRVHIYEADVSDYLSMKRVVQSMLEFGGKLSGIIHAAGIPDSGILQTSTVEALNSEMKPKLDGTLVIHKIVTEIKVEERPEVILFSSLSSKLGAIGQAGYTASNAFIDSYAEWASHNGMHVISINWDRWKETGMAYNAVKRMLKQDNGNLNKLEPITHPLLNAFTDDIGIDGILFKEGLIKSRTYFSRLSKEDDWVLNEHKIQNQAVLPGTVYVEMLHACMKHYARTSQMVISEIYLLEPLVVIHEAEIRILLSEYEEYFDFKIVSGEDRGEDYRIEHANGIIQKKESVPGKTLELGTHINRLPEVNAAENTFTSKGGAMKYGPRWNNIVRLMQSSGAGLAFIDLPGEYQSDFADYEIHPAILDTAIGFMEKSFAGNLEYLPISYKNVTIYGSLEKKVCSYIEKIDEVSGNTLSVSCVIADTNGKVLISIDEFTMKKVNVDIQNRVRPEELNKNLPRHMNYSLEIDEVGDFDNLYLKYSDRKAIGNNEVEIEVYTNSLNFKEVLYATGSMGLPEGSDFTFGMECAGVIASVGKNVRDFKIGDPVMAITYGSCAGYVVVESKMVMHIPLGMTFEEAATIPVSYMTAYYALVKRGNLEKKEKVLIHSATGGVGMAAVNIAKWVGADIIATAGSGERRDYLKSLDVCDTMNSRDLIFADKILSKYGGVDVILNSIPGKAVEKGLGILNYHGRFLEIGVRDILENNTINMRVFEKGITYAAINIGSHIQDYDVIFKEITDHVGKGHWKPLPYKIYDISEIKEAFSYMAGARHIGKIVIQHKNGSRHSGNETEQSDLVRGISNSEGIEVFERIIWAAKCNPVRFGQVVVSNTDFSKRLAKGVIREQEELINSIKELRGTNRKRKRPQVSADYAPPVTDAERELVQIFTDYLEINKIGINDNFFELGASSLDMIQINSKINKKYTKDTSIVKVYSCPTVSQLAGYLTEENNNELLAERDSREKMRSKEGRNKTLHAVKRNHKSKK